MRSRCWQAATATEPTIANQNSAGYAIDASTDKVLIAADGSGGAYVGGSSNARGWLVHLDGIATNTPTVVRLDGADVWVGGRIAITPFDTQYADGFLLNLDQTTGAYNFGSFYDTGKGAEEMTEHRVKGIVFDSTHTPRVAAQGYTSTMDFEGYAAFWYQAPDAGSLVLPAGTGADRLVDYVPAVSDSTASMVAADVANGTVQNLTTTTVWVDVESTVERVHAWDAAGPGSHGHTAVMKLDQ